MIYQVVIDKLRHYAKHHPTGLERLLDDKRTILLFVQLERYLKEADIEQVQCHVRSISKYFRDRNKLQLMYFVYHYILFFGRRRCRLDNTIDSNISYARYWFEGDISDEEVAILQWAKVMRRKYEKCYRIL